MTETIIERPSPNCREREPGSVIDTLVLHYTGMQTGEAAIERLCDPEAAVSSHYVVEEDGRIFRLVPEALRAAHAGISFWRGRSMLNDTSIGIEIVNPGHDWGYRPFPASQIEAVGRLCLGILDRHPIPSIGVVAHSDIAPERKQDPGELFPWAELAVSGIGVYPVDPVGSGTGQAVTDAEGLRSLRQALVRVGFDIDTEGALDEKLRVVLTAFQRHWRPGTVNGQADVGTRERAAALASLVP